MKKWLRIVKECLLKTFDYEGRETRRDYLVFLFFQLIWFCIYLQNFIGSDNEIGIIALLLFILPTFSCGVRRANDVGYSRGMVALLVIAPYLLFPFLIFPPSAKEKGERR